MVPGRAAPFPRAGLATPHYLASAAGAAVLARGGNAIDAIVGANLALGVVAPYYCGYGGDIFAIVWDGELHGYLGSGRSPAGATIDAVRDALDGTPLLIGPHSVTVPGAVAGWFELLARWAGRGPSSWAIRTRAGWSASASRCCGGASTSASRTASTPATG